MFQHKKISAIIPAFNEEQSIGLVIQELQSLIDCNEQPIIDEIIVCNNASTDATAHIALELGAKVVYEPLKGYGAACLKAATAVTDDTDILLYIDADASSFTHQAIELLAAIEAGYDLVIGSRPQGIQQKHSLTPQQIFGNWLATKLITYLWQHKTTDLGPFRAIQYSAYRQLAMQDQAFGWTIEMQIKAIQHNFKIKEVIVDSKKRIGQSKISGTLTGSILAGLGIFNMIGKLWLKQHTYNLFNRMS